jgi:hypothetical protein
MIHIMTSINGVSYIICVWWDINEGGGLKKKKQTLFPKWFLYLGQKKQSLIF